VTHDVMATSDLNTKKRAAIVAKTPITAHHGPSSSPNSETGVAHLHSQCLFPNNKRGKGLIVSSHCALNYALLGSRVAVSAKH